MKEELRLCESFDELQCGMIVVIKGCDLCGRRKCRGQLVHFFAEARAWSIEPHCSIPTRGLPAGIGEFAVGTGRVYIVIDGLEAPSQATSKPRRHPKPARVG